MYQFPFQQRQDIQFVNGIESARMYQLMPNSRTILMDQNDNVFYLVQADAAGQRTIKAFSFTELAERKTEYVTREEFDRWRAQYEPASEPGRGEVPGSDRGEE